MYPANPQTAGTVAGEPESQEDLERERELRERKLERARQLNKEKKQAQLDEDWKSFMRRESRELDLRKNGQLTRQLGEPLPGEPPAALRQLVLNDRKQAQKGIVTLMSGGKTYYKHIDDLTREDMPARIAANRLRTTWLKERRDGWLANKTY